LNYILKKVVQDSRDNDILGEIVLSQDLCDPEEVREVRDGNVSVFACLTAVVDCRKV
jgi:hypothetical protein